MTTIKLYDLARVTKSGGSWSYNVWKTRLALNYKGISYTTIWVDHSTIKSTLEAIGVTPNTSGKGFEYTVPTVKLQDDSIITESAKIASKLEDIQPSPSLRLDTNLQAEADSVVRMVYAPLLPIYMPHVAREVIDKSTVPAFAKSRHARFGMSLEEMEGLIGEEQAWEATKPGFEAMKKLLRERKEDEGPFIHGSQLCYADFVLVAVFEALRRVGIDMFEKAIGMDPSFEKLYDACEAWVQNDQ
ncbi:glutathione s-transferase [Penicillium angulare]|uniref:glutathione s-transferase n=1 Tax=Penicillium angulare TaxID=116970 RepID=UPI0025422469|nr:glutathione s-transferase [Penicillium angulare]KAJ5267663.1 glutathione s-transferase [Penicillium angulare]